MARTDLPICAQAARTEHAHLNVTPVNVAGAPERPIGRTESRKSEARAYSIGGSRPTVGLAQRKGGSFRDYFGAGQDGAMASPPGHQREDNERPIEEVLHELRQLRSVVDRIEQRRRRMIAMLLALFLVLTPAVLVGAHVFIDYESGRVAHAIEQSSGPFTDEALRRVCRSIKIPLLGPETKKRLHCPPTSETDTEPSTTTTSPPAPPESTAPSGQ